MLGFSRGSETGLELMPEQVTPTCTPPRSLPALCLGRLRPPLAHSLRPHLALDKEVTCQVAVTYMVTR